MSATGLDVFDRTLQTTHIWLEDIKAMRGPDRQVAWKVPSLAANLGAQLPLFLRGAYCDQFEPQPIKCDRDRFAAETGSGLCDSRPVDAEEAVRAAFVVLSSPPPQRPDRQGSACAVGAVLAALAAGRGRGSAASRPDGVTA